MGWYYWVEMRTWPVYSLTSLKCTRLFHVVCRRVFNGIVWPSETGREFPHFFNTPSATVPRNGNAICFKSCWRHTSHWRRQGISRFQLNTWQLGWHITIERMPANQNSVKKQQHKDRVQICVKSLGMWNTLKVHTLPFHAFLFVFTAVRLFWCLKLGWPEG